MSPNFTPKLHDEVEEEATEEEEQHKVKAFQYFEQPAAAKVHHFYISKLVGEPEHYIEMIHRIKFAGPHDMIYIYLNTAGGYLGTGVQLMSAMKMSNAHVVTVVEGEVCSLGTLIFLSGDEMVIQDGSLFMIHNHSSGQAGKGHEYLAQANATAKWFEEIARKTYLGFLTESEFDRMIKGEDFWMTTEEVRKRLTKYCKYLEKQAKEAQMKEEEKVAKALARAQAKKEKQKA